MNTYIKKIGVFLPGDPISNHSLSERFRNQLFDTKILKSLFGAEYRHFADKDMQCSDMACEAASKILSVEEKKEIDLLIFSAASSDLIEPATSNIVQHKLNLQCPVMDIKNACNSFVSAMQVATAFIGQGIYTNILIVTGEKLSDTIRFGAEKRSDLLSNLASLSFGDAGSAVWLSGTNELKGIQFQAFLTMGDYWKLSTVPGGGSMHPFNPDKNYFHGQTTELINILRDGKARTFILDSIARSPWEIEEIDIVITHQVADQVYTTISETLGISIDKIHKTFHKYGNTAAASIPLSLQHAMETGKAKSGDKVLLLGLAAGISVSVQLLII